MAASVVAVASDERAPQPQEPGVRARDAQRGQQRPRAGGTRRARSAPRADDRAEHPRAHERRDRDRHDEVARAPAAARVHEQRSDGARDEDADREGDDAVGHDGRALVVVVGHLGRHGDVRHLEQRVGGRCDEERDAGPQRGATGGQPGWCREHGDEERWEQQRPREHPRPPSAPPGLGAVRPAADQRVPDDVPQLRDEDGDTGEARGDAEGVGEEVEQQQAGHRPEGTGRQRAQRVPDIGAAAESSRPCHLNHARILARAPAARALSSTSTAT
jgi:hypothetical protein